MRRKHFMESSYSVADFELRGDTFADGMDCSSCIESVYSEIFPAMIHCRRIEETDLCHLLGSLAPSGRESRE